jgi:hypothetical protein
VRNWSESNRTIELGAAFTSRRRDLRPKSARNNSSAKRRTHLPPGSPFPSETGYSFFATEMARMKNTRQITRKRKKRNFAIPAAAEAIPVNPNNAATSAITKKIKAQRNILLTSLNVNSRTLAKARVIIPL